jgi:mannose-6-phosphate isomerase-like protein (cupin superfamily)
MKKHLLKLAHTLLKLGKTREVFMVSDMVNHAFDPEHDKGRTPWVIDIEELTKENDKFRSTEWTGQFLQMTVMSIDPGEDIGLEVHRDVDQFIRIEDGDGRVEMGYEKDDLAEVHEIEDDFAIFIPAGTWHNIINTGEEPLKIYSIYSPPEHPPGTMHGDKAEAEKYEEEIHGEG